MVRCTICAAEANIAAKTPQQQGWTQIELRMPRGNRYLVACPTHDTAAVVSWVKSLLSVKGKA
jgi:hypothetical protein